ADPFDVCSKLVEHLVEDSLISHRGPADFIAVGAQFGLLKPIPVERIPWSSRNWWTHVCVVVDVQLEIISAPEDDYLSRFRDLGIMVKVFGVIWPFAVTVPSLFLPRLYQPLERSFSLTRGFMVRVGHSFIRLAVFNHKFDDDCRLGSNIHSDLLPFFLSV